MEASPFSFTPERYWTEEKERALIAFFSKHSCLWNHKSENYKNRQLRWKTLEHLRILLSAHPPPVPFTVEDIKNKFKNLRTTFQRQYKMMKASKGGCRSDEVFVPQWKHYQQLMFLQGCWDQGGEEDPLPLSPPPGPVEESQPGLIISFLPTPPTPSPSFSSSSCVPSNIMAKCYWTEERERALIAFYSEHNCLWNKKSENHNNRQLRQRLLEALRSQLFDHSLSLSVEDLKGKFKNLRTVFNREYKAVRAGQAWDKPYTSKWKHYKQMLFLCDQDACDQEEEDLSILMDPREDKELIEHGNQTPSPTLSSFSSNSPQTNSINTVFNTAQSSDAKATYQIYLPSSPETLRLATPDTKPCTNPPPLDVSASASVQTDCRQQSSDARVHWTEAKVQQIISFYSEHSCLWNHKSESYRNRLLRQSLLETLSSVLSDNEPVPFTVEDIKTKFRNLRTIFQREHKAASSNKTCGSEDFYLPKWKHFQELMFLCDSCDEEDQPPPRDLHFQRAQESSQTLPSSLQYTQTDTKLTVTSPPSPTPPDSRPSSSFSSSSHTDSRLSGCKRTSRRPRPHTNHVLDLMRTFCQSQTLSPHSGFLKYVEECLNETPPDKVRKLKKKIIDTIHSVSEEEL